MKKTILALGFLSSILMADNIGQDTYAKCTGCHGSNGEKSALGKSAVITGQDKELTITQLTAYKNGSLNAHGMGGLMKGQLATLNEEDIKNVAEYISNMK